MSARKVFSERPVIRPLADARLQLQELGMASSNTPLRLHLGCGQQRLEGYVNVDFPPSEHSVQQTFVADVVGDLRFLRFPHQTVEEVRLHHVLEHFDRPTALALLCQWRIWLKPGGVLLVETPDFDASVELYRGLRRKYKEQQKVLRHVFGSHEASWAVHYDGWYEGKYRRMLPALGFENLAFAKSEWKMTRNITVRAAAGPVISPLLLRGAAAGLLREAMIDESPSEQMQWEVWCSIFDQVFAPPE